jgi:hypothetical protein
MPGFARPGAALAAARAPGLRAWRGLERDLAGTGFLLARPDPAVVTAAELEALPSAARAWVRFFGVEPGQAKRGSFRAFWGGKFRLAPNRPWMTIEAVQLTMARPIRRWFRMNARLGGLLPIVADDSYVGGQGHMVARVAELVTVADGKGPKLDVSELVTWVNDCVLFAPSMLLGPACVFRHVDDRTFELSVTDWGQTVTARVLVDGRGAPADFETDDRYVQDPEGPHGHLIRRRWRTPIDGWEASGSHVHPSGGRAIWELAGGPFVYANFRLVPEALAYDPSLKVPALAK